MGGIEEGEESRRGGARGGEGKRGEAALAVEGEEARRGAPRALYKCSEYLGKLKGL